ncbi:MAG: hypothetical protein GXO42_00825 [bacterium]|nr:hypothetical protein [bacterium]
MVRDSVLYDRLSAGLREIAVKAIKESRKRQIDPAVKKEIAKISALLLLQAKAMQSPCTTKQLEKFREMLRRAGCSAALLHKIADMQVFVELLPKLRALQHFLLCYKRAAHCLSYFTYLLLENSMLGEAIARVRDTITLERNTSERLKLLVSALAFFLQLKPDIIIELNNAISSSQDLMESLKRAVELVGIPSLLLDFKTTLSEQKLQKIVQSKKMIDPLLANELHELVEQTKTYEELLFAYILP